MSALLLFMPFLLAACGEISPQQPFFPRKLGSLPAKVLVSGQWLNPRFQSRELGDSRLVQLSGAGLFRFEPEVTGLAEVVEFDRVESFQWQEPPREGCALTQVSVSKEASSPLTLSFQFWGWDRLGNGNACEALLRRSQTGKVRFLLKGVKISGASAVEEIQFELNTPPA